MINLDFAATTPMSEEAIAVYREVARNYAGNPGSFHDLGSSAKRVVEASRETIANAINGEPRGLFFTGSGSEANRLAIHSLVRGNCEEGNHIITTAAEHSSVLNTMELLHKDGYEISHASLDEDGRVVMDELRALINDDTILISIHHGNSEIGTLQDIEATGKLAEEKDILFHSDCVQTFGKVPVNIQQAKLDSITISAHKIYGPKGVGAAYLSPSSGWKPLVPGTTQEKGFRPGTVDTPAIAAFAASAKNVLENMEGNRRRESELREHLLNSICSLPFNIEVEGSEIHTLPNILGLRIEGMEGQYAMLECNRHGLAISTGSACSVGTEKESPTMLALQRNEQERREFIRLSLGKETTRKEIEQAVKILEKVLTQHFNMVKL